MKRFYLIIALLFTFNLTYSQTTVYTTGQTYGDAWTGWTAPVTTNVSGSSITSDIYQFNLSGTGNSFSLEISRMFSINSNDIDIYLAATGVGTNTILSVEYSEDNSSWTQIGSVSFGAGFGQQTLIVPTFAPGPIDFYLKAKIVGVVGMPSTATFNNLKIDAELSTESVSISPTSTQNILTSTNGTTLTANEAPSTATSREWKYSSTSGSGYASFGSAETGTTYTPNFDNAGTYYVVCESTFSGNAIVSNEVQIVVSSSPSSVEELDATNQLLYFNNTLSVIMENNDYEISIYNISGQLILQENNLINYNFSDLDKGIYIVNMISKSGEQMTIKVSNF